MAAVLRASLAGEHAPRAVRDAIAGLGPDDLRGLAGGAAWHGVAGYVRRATAGLDVVPVAEVEALAALLARTVGRHLRVGADLAVLRGALDAADIPWLVVKGPTLAEPVHGSAELRSYQDLDVVVSPRRLGEALRVLEAAGCEVLDQNWTLIRREMKGEVHLRLPSGTPLDLHWHLLNDRPLRDRFAIDMDGVLDRRVTVVVDQTPLPTLSPEDTVVYVALHAAVSGADRLIWLKDVERLLAQTTAPAAVAERAAEWRAELALATAVQRTVRAIESPPAALELARPRGPHRAWLAIDRLATRVSPPDRQDGSGSVARLVARSVRPGQARSLGTLAGKFVRFAVGGGPRKEGRLAPDDPRSGRYPAGGAVERDAYLAAVAARANDDPS